VLLQVSPAAHALPLRQSSGVAAHRPKKHPFGHGVSCWVESSISFVPSALHSVPQSYRLAQQRPPMQTPLGQSLDLAQPLGAAQARVWPSQPATHPGPFSLPFGAGSHAPSFDAPLAALHTSHGPAHADAQHTPSVQKPLAQSPSALHVLPVFARHVPEGTWHSSPEVQPVFAVQLVEQPVLVPSHAYAPQALGAVPAAAGWQVPDAHEAHGSVHAVGQHTPPEHRFGPHSLGPLHAAPAGLVHTPAAQVPPVQLSESVPLTAAHCPGEAALAQLWHVPQLALSQHTPSTQKPVAHSLPWVQAMGAGAYSQVSPRCVAACSGSPFDGLPPNSTTTPRVESKAMAAWERAGGLAVLSLVHQAVPSSSKVSALGAV
jgi:hypothetical protein